MSLINYKRINQLIISLIDFKFIIPSKQRIGVLMQSRKSVLTLSFIIVISIVMTSGCTFDMGNLINQKNDSKGDIIQYTVNVDQNNNNSYHVNGMVENRAELNYSSVNLTVTGYNAKKEPITQTKITLPKVLAHDYANYDAWLTSSSGEKITTATIEFINGTKG